MKKESLIWLIVRLVGCVFGYWAAMSSLAFVGSVYLLTLAPEPGGFGTAVIGQIVYVAIYWLMAIYLIRDGRLFFDLLNTEGDLHDEREPVNSGLDLNAG